MISSEAFPSAGDTVQRFLNTLGNAEVGTPLTDPLNRKIVKISHGVVTMNGYEYTTDAYATDLRAQTN